MSKRASRFLLLIFGGIALVGLGLLLGRTLFGPSETDVAGRTPGGKDAVSPWPVNVAQLPAPPPSLDDIAYLALGDPEIDRAPANIQGFVNEFGMVPPLENPSPDAWRKRFRRGTAQAWLQQHQDARALAGYKVVRIEWDDGPHIGGNGTLTVYMDVTVKYSKDCLLSWPYWQHFTGPSAATSCWSPFDNVRKQDADLLRRAGQTETMHTIMVLEYRNDGKYAFAPGWYVVAAPWGKACVTC